MSVKIQLGHTFEDIISLDNLLLAWQEFICGKRNRRDAQEFQLRLMDNLILLYRDLATGNYRHSGYQAFSICDPKPRNIHKAGIRDRLVHRALYRILYPFFNRTFIADSFSSRLGKGTHKAVNRFRTFARKTSRNNYRVCWILKGDIRKFFANIDHRILKGILAEYLPNRRIIGLLEEIINSFCIKPGVGLPLGNLTSQLLMNIYLNKFDQFIKHRLKVKHYIRYADDFVIFSDSRNRLKNQIELIRDFLAKELRLDLHPDKLFIKTLNSGLDFLGWVNFFDHRVLRTSTKRRMFRKIVGNSKPERVCSYLGLLSHGNSHKLKKQVASLSDIC